MDKSAFSNRNLDILGDAGVPKSFTIFEDETQPDFKFKPLSNKTIREVCAVWCNSKYSSDEERLYYAGLGEIQPDNVDEETGEASYSFKNTYASQTALFGALAGAMFVDFPELVELNEHGVAIIKDEDLSDKLLRDQVHEAFGFFLGKFGAIPFGPASLLTNLANGLSEPNIGAKILSRMFTANGTKQTPKGGPEQSQADSDGGNLSQSSSAKETPKDSESSTSERIE